jgi:hypothetical protein
VATRSATPAATSSSSTPGRRIANSSPPKRAIVSPGRSACAQALGDDDEQLVARGVAERVVDDLELVEIDEQHGGGAGPSASASFSLNRVRFGRPGQLVVVRLVVELGLDLLADRDVEHVRDERVRVAVAVADDGLAPQGPAGRAVGARERHLVAALRAAARRSRSAACP